MTHDELMEQVKFKVELAEIQYLQELLEPVSALRAVVELHKPIQDKKIWCKGCRVEDDDWYSIEYPCPTIQAIEKELQ